MWSIEIKYVNIFYIIVWFSKESFINDVKQRGEGGWSFCDTSTQDRAYVHDRRGRGVRKKQIGVTSFMNVP